MHGFRIVGSGRRLALVGCLALAWLGIVGARPAHGVHLFPLTPSFDPIGHDCAKNLQAPGAEPTAASVLVGGFSFVDEAAKSSATTIAAGESVTWRWLADHCHSVTFSDGSGTAGAPGFAPSQPELVRIGGGNTYSATFPAPGVYHYICVHHAGVGMSGSVTVTGG